MDPFKTAGKRGNELEDSGRFEEALKAYALMMGGCKRTQLFSYLSRAILLRKMNRFDESIDLYRLATKHSPEFEESTCNLYHCLLDCGRFDEAMDEARRFFDGRLEQPHPHPVIEEFRQLIVMTTSMDEATYNRTRQAVMSEAKGLANEPSP